MLTGHYSVKVKPYIQASIQHAGAFSGTDRHVLFDWTEVKVPNYINRLAGCAALIRGTNGVRQEQPIVLYFSKSDNYSLGTIRAANTMQPNNDIIASMTIAAKHYTDGLNTMEVAAVPRTEVVSMVGATAAPAPRGPSGSSERSIYIGAIAGGDLDFQSTVKTDAALSAGSSTDISVDTTSALINFAKGDLIHAHDDAVAGTVLKAAATGIVLEEENQQALANNDDLYNVNPVTILLDFTTTKVSN